MTLPLTKEMLAGAYEYLKATPPFNKWHLPETEEVGFKVVRTRQKQGWYQWDGQRHTITGSYGRVAHTTTLMVLMAHEMIHLHLEETGMESKRGSNDTHNAAFRILAARVCKFHGFDPKAFY
jgi:hypothetical protein